MMATRRPSLSRTPRCASRSSSASCARNRCNFRLISRIGKEVDFFLGKIDRRLDMHAQGDQRVLQRIHLAREHAFHRTQRGACTGLRTRGDEIGHGFGLGEIELAVEEGALGEFAWARQARPECAYPSQQGIEQDRTAMALQFQHVLAGVGGRGGEVQQQPAIDQFAVAIAEGGEMRVARLRRAAEQDFGHRRNGRTGHA